MDVSKLKQMVPVLLSLSKDLIIFLEATDEETNDEDTVLFGKKLEKYNIPIMSHSIRSIQHDGNGYISSIVVDNNSDDDNTIELDALYIRPPLQQQPIISKLHEQLGLQMTENDGYIQVDEHQRTSILGVFACGDCTTSNRSLSIAVGSGTKAGKMLHYELSTDKFF